MVVHTVSASDQMLAENMISATYGEFTGSAHLKLNASGERPRPWTIRLTGPCSAANGNLCPRDNREPLYPMEAHMASLLEPHSNTDVATGSAHADSQVDESVFIQSVRNQGAPFSLAAAEPLVIPTLPTDADENYSESLKANIRQATFRVVDVMIACTLLILMSPIMITCWLFVVLSGPGPVLFRHMRIGKNGQPFACYKFRTMVDGAEAMLAPLLNECDQSRSEWTATYKLQNDPRVTAVGRVLRQYSLDELPQLFNVLIGNMSFVGPRPIVKEEIVRYGEFFLDYCSVKPGLSGLWQVSGKNSLSYEERVRLDTQYARSKSLWKDIVILWRTIPVVLLGRSS